MTRIGVISDTHLTYAQDLPKKLTSILSKVDMILHAGDLVSWEICSYLRGLGPAIHIVCGNMDSPQIKKALPEKEIIQVNGLRIGLTHGAGAPFYLMQTVKEKFAGEKLDCVVFGHSHSPFNQLRQDVLYFNPGSPTDKFFAPYNSYGVLEIGKKITAKIIKLR